MNAFPATADTVRKLVVEVLEARDLLPKDGHGSSSPYVIVEFEGQRRRTQTKIRDLNPRWYEALEFEVVDPDNMEAEKLEIEVYNDKRYVAGRKNLFLGRVVICGSQFSRRGSEGIVYHPLERKSLFSWIRGEIGLRIYYYDEYRGEKPPGGTGGGPPLPAPVVEQPPNFPPPVPSEAAIETLDQAPPIVVVQEVRPLSTTPRVEHPQFIPEVRKAQSQPPSAGERVRVVSRRPNGEYAPKVIPGRSAAGETERMQATYDLVEPMQYLFIRIVKARELCAGESPYVKIRTGSHSVRTKPAVYLRPCDPRTTPEWNKVFALPHNRQDSTGATLEISVWDASSDAFLGGVCFDLSDVPVRDPPDSPLATQWYRLEGGEVQGPGGRPITGDIMLSVWLGTQADEAFPESWSSDCPYIAHTRSKVYQSPKLWYLRATIIEAQDVHPVSGSPGTPPGIRVVAQLGFQSLRTRRSMASHSSSFHWQEDLIFVAGEPLKDDLILIVEDQSTSRGGTILGHVIVPISNIVERLDERPVPSKWFGLGDGGPTAGAPGYRGRIQVRLCLEGGYHVLDEAAHLCSDFRPTAKQLWKPPVGVLELGILGARGLLPMKRKDGAKGSTDAYCVAKYGKKWARTRTISDNFDPRWNEQYTWQVYDPCTVLTVAVFDNWRMFADAAEQERDWRIGMVRVRVSTLESNRVYASSYPLLVLNRGGVKKMGEIEIAIRFACHSLLPETCAAYGQPMLPRMHYVKPLGVAQQERLREAATSIVAEWLERSEPPLGREVVSYMLDAESHAWSMRRSKANWFRIMAVIGWAIGLARWIDDIRRWRNPLTTVLFHVLYLVLVWYPDLIVPTVFLYVFLIGAWYYRFRPRIPAGMDVRLSQADTVDPDELDEEFDPTPSERPEEVVRMRYDRLRTLAGRVQRVLGDIAAQGERVQALVSWRDPRATRMFIGACVGVALLMYVVPSKMVAVALGFYLLRHPMFRDPMPPATLNFFRRLPSLSDRLI